MIGLIDMRLDRRGACLGFVSRALHRVFVSRLFDNMLVAVRVGIVTVTSDKSV